MKLFCALPHLIPALPEFLCFRVQRSRFVIQPLVIVAGLIKSGHGTGTTTISMCASNAQQATMRAKIKRHRQLATGAQMLHVG
jgi:hypothetical protein